MTNEMQPRSIELTSQGINIYSSSRSNFMPDGTTGSPDIGPKPQNTDVIVSGKRISLQKSADGRVSLQNEAESTAMHESLVEGLAGGPLKTPEGNIKRTETPEDQISRVRSEMRPMAGGAIDPIIDLGTKTFTNPTLKSMVSRLVNLRSASALDEGVIDRFSDDLNEILRTSKNPAIIGQAVEIKQALAEALRSASGRRGAEAEQQRAVDDVLEWIFDPEVREQYFNDIYALVDARPSEFWQEAFNPLTDGAKEEEFMKVVLEGSRARWTEIIAGDRYRGVNLTNDDIARGLAEANSRAGAVTKNMEDIRGELEKDFYRYIQERAVRKVLHNVNAVLYLPSIKPEQLYEQMQQFQSSYGDIAFKTPGVRDMMSLYEESLYECMAQNHGFLDQEAVLGEVTNETTIEGKLKKNVTPGIIETRVKDRFKKMMEAGLIVIRTENGDVQVNDMKQWEIDRTFTMARGMMVMSERLIEIAAESKLPPGDVGRYASVFLQDVVQGIAPWRHLVAKFDIPEEGIASLLFDSEMGSFFKNWDPHKLMEEYKRFKNDPAKFLETADQFYYGKINPNRAGSIWSWNSWRANENPEIRTSLQRFLLEGRERMKQRWADAGNAGEPPAEFLDEYQNWSGTGFRFERLRGKMAGFDSEDKKEKHEAQEAIKKAHKLFETIVNFQPHRLYLSSMNVRRRVLEGMGVDEANMTEAQKLDLQGRIDNLSAVETAFLRNRERLLDEGRTFNTITLSDMEQFYEFAIPDLTERQKAMELAEKIRGDFANHKDDYWREYIYKREYNHGFVLWTGDVPVDEYNMGALGPTGGFARRARDNDHQSKAAGLQVGLLDNLKNMEHPDQVLSALYGVFHEIEGYDVGKARQAIAEEAEGIIKFYKMGSLSKVFGPLRKTSFARLSYGPHAAAWGSQEIHYLVQRLEHAKMIDEEQAERLAKLTGGTLMHATGEGAIAILEALFIALILSATETSFKEGFKDVEAA